MKRARSKSEIDGILKLFKDPQNIRERLEDAARQRQDTFERAATSALNQLRMRDKELTSIVETVALSRAVAGDPQLERFAKLREEHAKLTIRLADLEQAAATVSRQEPRIKRRRDAPRRPVDDVQRQLSKVTTELEDSRKAVLELLLSGSDVDPVLAAEKARFDAARDFAVQALVEQGILPLWRELLNVLLESGEELSSGENRRYRKSLEGARAEGLSALPDREREISTDAHTRLERVFDQLPGGSIGISGPRGVGKTTLIRSACQAEMPRRDAKRLSVMVYAPVKYASLDFVLHLFEMACRASLPADRDVDPLEQGADARLRRSERSIKLATRIAVGVGLAAGIIGVLLTIDAVKSAGAPEATRQLLAAAAVVGVSFVIVVIAMPRWRKHDIALGAMVASAAATAAVLSTIVDDWSLKTWALIALAAAAGWPLLILVPAAVAELSIQRLWQTTAGVLLVGAIGVGVAAATGHELDAPSDLGAALVLGAAILAPAVARIVRTAFVFDPSAQTRHSTLPRVQLIASSVDRLAKDIIATGTVVAIAGLAVVAMGWLATPPTTALCAALTLVLAGGALAALLSERSPIAGLTLYGDTAATLSQAVAADAPTELKGWASGLEDERLERLEALANASLQRIKYQRASNAGWSTKVGFSGSTFKLPFSAEAGSSGGRTATEQAMTLPEVVALLRDFLQTASTTAGCMVVGIDEIDKMGTEEDAERFLNDVKAIFGIPKCYFFISVSEDAVASFERRGMPFRDVFDSALDDVLRVDHLDEKGTEELLTARTIDMSQPFKALCHALAGGLPRDVIRVARRLFDLRDRLKIEDLGPLSVALTAAELRAKRDGTVTAAAQLGAKADATEILRWLADSRIEPDTAALQEALVTMPTNGTDGDGDTAQVRRALDRLVRELAAYWYLCATLTDFFTDQRQPVDFVRAERPDHPGSIEQLAQARQAFTIDPGLAWKRVTAFREDWGLVALSLPTAAQAVPAPAANGSKVEGA